MFIHKALKSPFIVVNNIFLHFQNNYIIYLKFIQSFVTILMFYGGIGEGVNTPDCGSGMRGFESHISPHIEFYAHLCAKDK